MVECKGFLKPFGGDLSLEKRSASVIDQHMQLLIFCLELLCYVPDLRHDRQIGDECFHRVITADVLDLAHHCRTLGWVAAHNDDGCAHLRQRCCLANAVSCACHEADFAV